MRVFISGEVSEKSRLLVEAIRRNRGSLLGAKRLALLRQTWSRRSFQLCFLAVRRTITNATWAEMKTAFATGSVSLRELARQMNIPEGTVLAHAKREGWTRQIESAKALTKREDAHVVTATEAVAITMQQRGERHVERMAGVSERAVDHIETMDGPEILNSVDRIEKLDKVARRTYGLDEIRPCGIQVNILSGNFPDGPVIDVEPLTKPDVKELLP
jgi:hypothetical protein